MWGNSLKFTNFYPILGSFVGSWEGFRRIRGEFHGFPRNFRGIPGNFQGNLLRFARIPGKKFTDFQKNYPPWAIVAAQCAKTLSISGLPATLSSSRPTR